MNALQVFCGSFFLFYLLMSMAKMLALIIAIILISTISDGVVGEPEALATVKYSLMAWNMVASELV